MTGVIMAAVVVGLIGLLIGLLLGFAAKAFAVPVDEKEIEVTLAGEKISTKKTENIRKLKNSTMVFFIISYVKIAFLMIIK